MPVALGLLRVQGASSGRPEEMEKCIAFSHQHNILPKISQYKLDNLPHMIYLMKTGQFEGRLVVVF